MNAKLMTMTLGLVLAFAWPASSALAMGTDSGSGTSNNWSSGKTKDDKDDKEKKTKKDEEKDKKKQKDGALDVDRAYDVAADDIAAQRYARALPRLRAIVTAEPGHADAWNLIGFASRKIGDLRTSWKAYQTALSIKPDHRGAREYLGEWYLQNDDVAGAVEQYRTLASLCAGPCIEKDTLEKAIVAYSVANLDRDAVQRVQKRLADAGYLDRAPDGRFDDRSIEALKAFQLANGIDEVGLFETTLRALRI